MLGAIFLINPYIFQINDPKSRVVLALAIFFTAVVLPIVSILMMRFLGFLSTLEMKDSKERIGPFIVVSVCYIWLFLNIRQNNVVPEAFSIFVLGAIISIFLAFFINLFEKTSLHALAMAGFVMGLIIFSNQYGQGHIYIESGLLGNFTINNIFLIAFSIFLLGLIATARIYLKSHSLREVLGGALIGLVGQVFALNIMS